MKLPSQRTGLWIGGPALLAMDSARVEKVVREGLASPDHAVIVERLLRAKERHH